MLLKSIDVIMMADEMMPTAQNQSEDLCLSKYSGALKENNTLLAIFKF
jgi:hypothetical protein